MYANLPINEELITSKKPFISKIDANKDTMAKNKNTRSNPLKMPYNSPPALLNCLIIGNSAIASAKNLITIKRILAMINIPINVIA